MIQLSILLAAVGGGIAAFFAPCAVPLLPGYLGYSLAESDDEVPIRAAVGRGGAAMLGVAVVFGLLALVVTALNRALLNYLVYAEPVIGTVLIGVGGLMLLGRMPTIHASLPDRPTTLLGFAIFGAGYAIAATGCMVGVFGAVLLGAMTASPIGGVLAVTGYAAGLGMPLFLATIVMAVGTDHGRRLRPAYVERVPQVAGALIVLAGLVQLYTSLSVLP
jgi:cytochrome c-type biogenesis protein